MNRITYIEDLAHTETYVELGRANFSLLPFVNEKV